CDLIVSAHHSIEILLDEAAIFFVSANIANRNKRQATAPKRDSLSFDLRHKTLERTRAANLVSMNGPKNQKMWAFSTRRILMSLWQHRQSPFRSETAIYRP